MTGKETLKKLKQTMNFMIKDGKYYHLTHFDNENNICCYEKASDSNSAKNSKHTINYEKACELFTIEIVENPPNLDSISMEKALLVYMSLVRKYKNNRKKIIYSKFSNTWHAMYGVIYENEQMQELKHNAFTEIKDNFANKSYEEIKTFREQFLIYDGREIPEEAKELADEKGVIVSLAGDRERYLSGFDVLVKEGKSHPFSIVRNPFSLSYEKLISMLNELPTKEELQKKEQHLINMLLNTTSCSNQRKGKVVDRYKAPYATHEFKKFMCKFTIYDCKSRIVTLACVNLCHRLGIRRLDNNKEILYKYCEGSGKREKNLKRNSKISNNNRRGR